MTCFKRWNSKKCLHVPIYCTVRTRACVVYISWRQHRHRHFNGLMDPLCIQRSHIQRTKSITNTFVEKSATSIHYGDSNLCFFIIENVDSLAARHITQNTKAPTKKCATIYDIHGQHFIDNALAQTEIAGTQRLGENLPSLMVFRFNFLAMCVCVCVECVHRAISWMIIDDFSYLILYLYSMLQSAEFKWLKHKTKKHKTSRNKRPLTTATI